MILFSKEHEEILRVLCVKIVYLFGSRVGKNANDTSDYDIGIVFEDASVISGHQLETYQTLYSILSEYFPDSIDGARPDISFLQLANAALEMSAIDGTVLFDADPRFRLSYEESVIKRYDDYKHLRNAYEEATFAAFSPA